jgi:hypothetical protein
MPNPSPSSPTGLYRLHLFSKRFLVLIPAALGLILFFTAGPAPGADKVLIYFYSAEANINNYKTLKAEFDSYLADLGPYEFQPFGDQTVFENRIRQGGRYLLLLSAWHYRNLEQTLSLEPMLVGLRNGGASQKRILVSAAADHLGPDPIASAGSLNLTQSILQSMFPAKTASDFNVLMVPKEIDALMSLAFESATYALVTESAKAKLGLLDPVLARKLKTLAEGEESLLPVLAAPGDFTEEARPIVSLVKQMPENDRGMNIMRLLDLDGWKPVGPSERSKLEG